MNPIADLRLAISLAVSLPPSITGKESLVACPFGKVPLAVTRPSLSVCTSNDLGDPKTRTSVAVGNKLVVGATEQAASIRPMKTSNPVFRLRMSPYPNLAFN